MDRSRRMSARPRGTSSDDSPTGSAAPDQSGTRSDSPAPSLTGERSPAVGVDFQFLNFSHPSEAKATRARRAVRSHVTRQQHQREHAAAVARRAHHEQLQQYQQQQPPAAASGTNPAVSASIPVQIMATTGPYMVNQPSMSQPSLARPAVVSYSVARAGPSTAAASSSSVPYGGRGGSPPPTAVSSASASSASPSPSASPTDPSAHAIDLSELYPETWRAEISRILDHYLSNMAVHMPDLDGSHARGLLRTRFFPFVMTHPAPLHAVMLMATAHYSNVHGARSHAINILDLRGMAIRAINAALQDPVRATSDQVIAAVAKLASYEAVYGDRATFHTHMTGLLRMVSLRGGLPALGLDGLLERILLWIDANAAYLTRSQIYFDPAAFPSRMRHPRPDPFRFAGISPRDT